jgi:hypothetical protein
MLTILLGIHSGPPYGRDNLRGTSGSQGDPRHPPLRSDRAAIEATMRERSVRSPTCLAPGASQCDLSMRVEWGHRVASGKCGCLPCQGPHRWPGPGRWIQRHRSKYQSDRPARLALLPARRSQQGNRPSPRSRCRWRAMRTSHLARLAGGGRPGCHSRQVRSRALAAGGQPEARVRGYRRPISTAQDRPLVPMKPPGATVGPWTRTRSTTAPTRTGSSALWPRAPSLLPSLTFILTRNML